MELKEFGIYFAKLREQSGFESQRQLAIASGVSNGTIARIEAGTQKATPETLKKLAPFLKGVTYEDLLKAAGYLEQEEINEQDILKKLKERVTKQVLNLDLSIEQLAEKIGWKPETLQAFMDNPTRLPGQKTLDKMAKALNVTRDYLLGYTDDPKGYGIGTYITDPPDLQEFVMKNKALNFGGDKMDLSEEEKEELLRHTRLAWMLIKERRQEKYGRKSKKQE